MCPPDTPVMCNDKSCNSRSEYCCERNCRNRGGERKCTTTTLSSTTTTKATTATTTTNTILQDLQSKVSANEAKLVTELIDMKEENSQLRSDLERLKEVVARLAATTTTPKPLERTTAKPTIHDEACERDLGNSCTPQFVADGSSVGIFACCGKIRLHGEDCVVDPCQLKQDVDDLKAAVFP